MEKFNYNTDKLVIVAYPIGAGGKFLINCLGISEDACLQDWELYNLTSIEKKALILDRMVATPKCPFCLHNVQKQLYISVL